MKLERGTNIQSGMKELFGGSCLAYCYAYLILSMKEEVTVTDLTTMFFRGWYANYIDDDGFVSKLHNNGKKDNPFGKSLP